MYILSSKVCGKVEFALILRAHDSLLLVVAHQLVFPSKEMFSMKLKGVLQVIHLLTAQLSQKAKRTLNYEAGNEI